MWLKSVLAAGLATARRPSWAGFLSTPKVGSLRRTDSAAVTAARSFTFRPAERNGKPVCVWIRLPVRFEGRARAPGPLSLLLSQGEADMNRPLSRHRTRRPVTAGSPAHAALHLPHSAGSTGRTSRAARPAAAR